MASTLPTIGAATAGPATHAISSVAGRAVRRGGMNWPVNL
jgi:hypothetical protein